MTARTQTDIELRHMAGITRPLQLRTAAHRRRERRRALVARLVIIAVVAALTLMLLGLPLIAVTGEAVPHG